MPKKMEFVLQKEKQEAERKRVEARVLQTIRESLIQGLPISNFNTNRSKPMKELALVSNGE